MHKKIEKGDGCSSRNPYSSDLFGYLLILDDLQSPIPLYITTLWDVLIQMLKLAFFGQCADVGAGGRVPEGHPRHLGGGHHPVSLLCGEPCQYHQENCPQLVYTRAKFCKLETVKTPMLLVGSVDADLKPTWVPLISTATRWFG